jgi:hypothetical protein
MEPVRPTLPDTLPPDSTAAAPPVRPTLPDATRQSPRAPGRRRRSRLLIAAVGLLALLGIGVAAVYRPLLRYLILREAARHGFNVDFEEASLSRHGVRLRGARVELSGVRGLRANFEELRVALDGFAPQRVDADGVAVAIEGSAADRILALSAWSSDHPNLYRIPGEGRRLGLTWSARAGEAPWLAWSDGVLTATGAAATFRTKSAAIEGVAVGGLGAAWSADSAVIAIGLGRDVIADANVRVELRPSANPPTADVTLAPHKLEDLGAPMGVGLPAPGAVVDGSARLTLGNRAARDAIEGSVTMTIKGWLPPHPRQLDRIVYGNSTAFTAKIRVSEDRKKVAISDAIVTAGGFKLKGKGAIDREVDHARAVLDFDGAIACTDVARSATASDWGDALAEIMGDVARRTMEGSVAVRVHVEVDTRDLRAAKVQHQIGVGCGFRMPRLF